MIGWSQTSGRGGQPCMARTRVCCSTLSLRRTGDDLHVSLHKQVVLSLRNDDTHYLYVMIVIIVRKLILILIITLNLSRLNPKDTLPPPRSVLKPCNFRLKKINVSRLLRKEFLSAFSLMLSKLLSFVYALRLIGPISYYGECDLMVYPRKYSIIFSRMPFCYLCTYITCTKIRNRPD